MKSANSINRTFLLNRINKVAAIHAHGDEVTKLNLDCVPIDDLLELLVVLMSDNIIYFKIFIARIEAYLSTDNCLKEVSV